MHDLRQAPSMTVDSNHSFLSGASQSTTHTPNVLGFRHPLEWTICFLEGVLGAIFLSSQLEFVHTTWWFMFDPSNLGVDLGAIFTFAIFIVLVPLIVEYRPLFSFIAKNVSKFQLLIVICHALNYPGAIPPRAKSVLLGIAFSLINICDFAIAFRNVDDFRRTRLFFGRIAGLLVLWLLGFGSQGLSPVFDEIWLHVVAFVLAVITLLWFGHEEHRSINKFRFVGYGSIGSQADSDVIPSINDSVNSKTTAKCGRLKKALKNWICLSFSWSSLLFLTLWMFGSIFVTSRWAGLSTYFAPFLVLGLAFGCVHHILVGKLGSQILSIVGIVFGTVMYCYGNFPGIVFTGSFMISFALPVMWWMTFSQMNQVSTNGYTGRCLALGGLFFFLYIVMTTIALFGGDTGLPLADQLHGNAKAVLWCAVILMSVFHGIFLCLQKSKVGDILVDNHWSNRLMLGFLTVAFVVAVPSILYFALAGGRSRAAFSDETTTVTAYNIQEGWTIDGQGNYHDVTRVLRAQKSEIICLPESETSTWLFGARDVTRYYAYTFGFEEYVGPPSSIQKEGVSLLSNLPILSKTYHVLPTLPECDNCPLVNRILLENQIRMKNGDVVTVFCTHYQYTPPEAGVLEANYTAAVVNRTVGPILLLGDLNFEPDSEAFGILNQTRLVSTIGRNTTTGTYDPTETVGFTHIDYIFYSDGDFRLLDSEIVEEPGISDHLPVSATFQ